MNDKDGLSRNWRMKRVTSLQAPVVVDNKLSSLLRQSLSIASFLKYYNAVGSSSPFADGYFEELLPDIAQMKLVNQQFAGDGNLEPAQAVLLNFLENLRQTTTHFNDRWKAYPQWYLEKVLGVKPLPMVGDKVWMAFENHNDLPVIIPQGTRFHVERENNETYHYSLAEDVEVHHVTLQKIYLLLFEKNVNTELITGLRISEFTKQDELIVGELAHAPTIGIRISSPMLLLREGIRSVTIILIPADKTGISETASLDSIFKLSISTGKGWSVIKEYTLTSKEEGLIVEFALPDSFPATVACSEEIHQCISRYPALKMCVDLDAKQSELLSRFLLDKIKIKASVQNISSILVYNELGKIDNSKPFAPFGINTEKGTWFTIGNYEMNIKPTKTVDVNLCWTQLPDHPLGLAGYYADYPMRINNNSFVVNTRYLADFKWQPTRAINNFPLFESRKEFGERNPSAPLSSTSSIENIDVEKMPLFSLEEEEYEYSLQAREGFLNFTLTQPEMGFGETVYRRVFTEQMMRNARRKKYPAILPPFQPLVERITINYEAEDEIDLTRYQESNENVVTPIVPLDFTSMSSQPATSRIWFVPSWEERNLLIALKDAKENALLNLFFELSSEEHHELESNLNSDRQHSNLLHEQRDKLKRVKFYLGNPHRWEKMQEDFIQKDETIALLINGRIQIQLPNQIDQELYDSKGLLWFRISYEEVDEVSFSRLKAVYVNAAMLEMVLEDDLEEKIIFNRNDGELVADGNIPGLTGFKRISPFYDGRPAETPDEMLVRISEYTSHKGRAVTPRDYERIALQGFPDIAKVKCIVNRHNEQHRSTVYLAVLPQNTGLVHNNRRPLTPPHLIFNMEKYFQHLTSSYVEQVKVINPVYEEIMIRCNISHKRYLSVKRKASLTQIVNSFIAPWQAKNELPVFGYSIDLKKIDDAIMREFGSEVKITDLSAIHVDKKHLGYELCEHFYKIAGNIAERIIAPSEAHSIFVPAENHIFDLEQVIEWEETFGIHEMEIGKTFIVEKNKDHGLT